MYAAAKTVDHRFEALSHKRFVSHASLESDSIQAGKHILRLWGKVGVLPQHLTRRSNLRYHSIYAKILAQPEVVFQLFAHNPRYNRPYFCAV
jgi:hypothetical protein